MNSLNLTKIVNFLAEEMRYQDFQDSSVNGLQIEASENINKIAVAVDYADSIVDQAISKSADLLITHHGMLWGDVGPITGETGHKIRKLINNKLSLIGIHLPLDAHPKFGNNIVIARDILKLSELIPAITYGSNKIGWKGQNSRNLKLDEIKQLLKSIEGALSDPLVLNFGPSTPNKICVVSGAAADALYQFKVEEFDTLITGEPRQFAYHFCKEHKLNAIFAGHYATETFGVIEVAKEIERQFGVPWVFINEPTGI